MLYTMEIIIMILTRIINFSPIFQQEKQGSAREASGAADDEEDPELSQSNLRDEAYGLLEFVRRATSKWTSALLDVVRKHDEQAVGSSDSDRAQLLRSALLCNMTFHLEAHVRNDGFKEEDLTHYTSSMLVIHNNRPASSTSDPHLDQALLRCSVWCYKLLTHTSHLAFKKPAGISHGIQSIWQAYKFPYTWTIVNGDEPRWLENRDAAGKLRGHFDLVSGELAMNGGNIRRLPEEFTRLSVYQQLFGQRVFEVSPSERPGMHYMAAHEVDDHEIHFGVNRNAYYIRVYRGDTVLEAIPSEIWEGEIPHTLVQETMQWMDLDRSVVYFRPLQSLWRTTSRDWELTINVQNSQHSHMNHGKIMLLSVSSPHLNIYAKAFRYFEDVKYIHTTLNEDNNLEIHLPRFGLRFIQGNTNELRSMEFAGYKLAKDQGLNTLYGLRSRLVFETCEQTPARRFVLIPYGMVEIFPANEHVSLHIIGTGKDKRVYFKYEIDPILNELRHSGDITAHFWLAYLHALTAFPSIDPLTGLTGLETSLSMLRQAFSRTTEPLPREALVVLGYIAKLSPVRKYHPFQFRSMEHVRWHGILSCWAQHAGYQLLVSEILSHNRRLHNLHGPIPERAKLCLYAGDEALLQRAERMQSGIYPFAAVSAARRTNDFTSYVSRVSDNTERMQAAFQLATLTKDRPSTFDVTNNPWAQLKELRTLGGFEKVVSTKHLHELQTLDIAGNWGGLLGLCRNCTEVGDRTYLSYVFSTIAFGNPTMLPVLRTLLAFAISPALQSLQHTFACRYDLDGVRHPNGPGLRRYIESHWQSLEPTGSNARSDQAEICLEELKASWPSAQPRLPHASKVPDLDTQGLLSELKPDWKTWFDNHRFYEFISQSKSILQSISRSSIYGKLPSTTLGPISTELSRPIWRPEVLTLLRFNNVDPEDFRSTMDSLYNYTGFVDSVDGDQIVEQGQYGELRGIVSRTANNHPEVLEYSKDLEESLEHLVLEDKKPPPSLPAIGISDLPQILQRREAKLRMLQDQLSEMSLMISPSTWEEEVLKIADFWPRVTNKSVLSFLSKDSRDDLPSPWFEAITNHAVCITHLQKLGRLAHFLSAGKMVEFQKELVNKGYEDWTPTDYPDFVLLQIESNAMIRDRQIQVAREMFNPSSGKNSSVQLQAGEGQSAMIIPMVVCLLADGTQLPRVIVLKPLLREMLDNLSQRLGGLLGRQVLHLNFTRQTALTVEVNQSIMSCCQRFEDQGGVLVTTPETVVSFPLLGEDKMDHGELGLGTNLFESDQWFATHTRDIIDEADSVLSVRYEMVYTTGMPVKMDTHPSRWTIAEDFYGLVAKHAATLARDYPTGVEYEARGPGCFPKLRILQQEAGKQLLTSVVDDICRGAILGPAFWNHQPNVNAAIRNFINDRSVQSETETAVRDNVTGTPRQTLYILRMLIAYGMGLYPVETKRVNVDFGQSPRSLGSVPYLALNTPSPSSDFGHPDTRVVTTIIDYYHNGLTQDQLKDSILILLDTPGREDEWAKWATLSKMDLEYRSIKCVNLENEERFDMFYDHLRFSKSAIDFLLNNKVFPKVGTEYKHKLSKSAEDIPKREGEQLTTAFSATESERLLLPHAIEQRNLPSLKHTNAQVLQMLMRNENREYVQLQRDGQRLDAGDSIASIVGKGSKENTDRVEKGLEDNMRYTVIIDAGAQILDLPNQGVAQRWLSEDTAAKAAVFFNVANVKAVIDRDGFVEPLVSSPFRDNLEGCLIYFDQWHARGVDYDLPSSARAAITTCAGMTLDAFIQGCCRLRKLGIGQSFTTFAPPEVHRQIQSMAPRGSSNLDIADVIQYLISQTCTKLAVHRTLHSLRGLSYQARDAARDRYLLEQGEEGAEARYIARLKTPESFTIEQLYGVRSSQQAKTMPFSLADARADPRRNKLVTKLEKGWQSSGELFEQDATVEIEHHKEIALEQETEKDFQRPPRFKPCIPVMTEALERLAQTGDFHEDDFIHAFLILKRSSAGKFLDAKAWKHRLFVTADYCATIEGADETGSDHALRMVNFVLTLHKEADKAERTLLIISQHEANSIYDRAMKSEHIAICLYTPRLSRAMADSDDLTLYQISAVKCSPPDPQVRQVLNIFAGSTFFGDRHRYHVMCDFLGVLYKGRKLPVSYSRKGPGIAADRFVEELTRKKMSWESPFTKSPLPFVASIISLRMGGADWKSTTMGKICEGKEPDEAEFETE